ncbi:MAG TPA: lysylphosphatidylglycerol synthase domain-containing protein [Candidatus Acidoferrum sp.]|nr:lysylphosphatidylglycerol synthase domain-containing protein [Candidatus Acidoferrum sp.]
MKLSLTISMLAGLALATGLVLYQGAGEVLGTMAALGWGFIPVAFVHVLQMVGSALGWRSLIEPVWPRPLSSLLTIRWIREGTNGLLPVAHIGGEVIGARMLSFRGVRGDVAGASVVVDLTLEVVTQFLFTLVGLTLLLLGDIGGSAVASLLAGIALAGIALAGFVIAQRMGLFKLVEHALDRVMARAHWLSVEGIHGLHDAIQAIHRRPLALAEGAGWHLLSWLLGTIEVWAALHFMGIGIGLRQALILESLGQAARSAGFVVPSGLGIQEGGLLLFGSMLGVPPEAALGLSLAKRLREVVLGLPAIAAWQLAEGRRLWQRRPSSRPTPGAC